MGAIISGLPFSLLAKQYSWASVFFLLEILTAITVGIMLFGHWEFFQPKFGDDKKLKQKLKKKTN